MQVPYIRASFEQAADMLSEKIASKIAPNKINYVSEKLCAANARLGDTFSNSAATKYLNKVGQKATSDWASMHKIQEFALKHSNKLAKGAIIGGAVAAAAALTAGVVHLVKHAQGKDSQ